MGASMGMRTAVCPHWGEVSIDDIYSGSASGQRSFTMHVLLGDVILVQPDAYEQVAFKARPDLASGSRLWQPGTSMQPMSPQDVVGALSLTDVAKPTPFKTCEHYRKRFSSVRPRLRFRQVPGHSGWSQSGSFVITPKAR